jgi:hypothetical protein
MTGKLEVINNNLINKIIARENLKAALFPLQVTTNEETSV